MTTGTHRDQIVQALGREHPEWLGGAYSVVERVARERGTVTTDDLWPLVTFPAGVAGGRLMGKVIRWALSTGIMGKATMDGYLLCLDHAELEPVRTLDGSLIRHQGPLVVYRSLLHDVAAARRQGFNHAPDRFGDERRLVGEGL